MVLHEATQEPHDFKNVVFGQSRVVTENILQRVAQSEKLQKTVYPMIIYKAYTILILSCFKQRSCVADV
jgi:hypothetical protein